MMTNDVVKKLYFGALEKIPYMSDENQFLTGNYKLLIIVPIYLLFVHLSYTYDMKMYVLSS